MPTIRAYAEVNDAKEYEARLAKVEEEARQGLKCSVVASRMGGKTRTIGICTENLFMVQEIRRLRKKLKEERASHKKTKKRMKKKLQTWELTHGAPLSFPVTRRFQSKEPNLSNIPKSNTL